MIAELLSMHYLLEVLLYQVRIDSGGGSFLLTFSRPVNLRATDGIKESRSERPVTGSG